jgi:hypothetical protein
MCAETTRWRRACRRRFQQRYGGLAALVVTQVSLDEVLDRVATSMASTLAELLGAVVLDVVGFKAHHQRRLMWDGERNGRGGRVSRRMAGARSSGPRRAAIPRPPAGPPDAGGGSRH